MNVHSAEWAKFLTTKAFYALASVYLRLVIDHFYSLRGADLLAFFTALAFFAFQSRLCLKRELGDLSKELGTVIKQQTVFDGYVLIIGYYESIRIAKNL